MAQGPLGGVVRQVDGAFLDEQGDGRPVILIHRSAELFTGQNTPICQFLATEVQPVGKILWVELG
jgi:hypothetical protein